MGVQEPQKPRVRPFDQQLDVDGRLHDLAPLTERLRLFEPDRQLPGQTRLDLPDTDA